VSVGDTVAIREESRQSPLFGNRAEMVTEVKTPQWMKLQDNGFAVQIETAPAVSETEAPFNAATIIQFYSR